MTIFAKYFSMLSVPMGMACFYWAITDDNIIARALMTLAFAGYCIIWLEFFTDYYG